MESIKTRIIVIVGPTASGKSDLAIKLAQKFNGEIISADSRQVYRYLDIGTGKVAKQEQRLAPHHLLDVASPRRVFTVAQFKKLGQKAIRDITKRGKLPIIVGGTGHYIDALVYDLHLPEVPPNKKLRAKLSRFASRGARLANRGSSIYYQNHKLILDKSGEKTETDILFAILQKLDPARASSIDPHNPRRLIRALEIIQATGKPIGEIKKESPYRVLWLGLNPKNVNQRIAQRVKNRLRRGWINEVKKLNLPKKVLANLGLGYREIGRYLTEEIPKKELEAHVILAETQYAKRQMTWFKRNKEIRWLKRPAESLSLVRKFLSSAAD